MAKRKQRRFTSEEQILKAIDSYTTRIHKALLAAEEFDKERSSWGEEQAIKLRRSVIILETKKKLMGEALSRFRTQLLPGLGQDTSVVL